MSPMPSTTEVEINQAVADLTTACDEAYSKYANSCSHAVWYVLQKRVDPKTQYLEANQLMDWLVGDSGWQKATVDDGWSLTQKGIVVVGGLKNPKGHGHVIVIYPGEKKQSGGYLYTYKDKKSGQMKTDMLRSHGIFPRALSTSMGPWPGAKSKGDKTVWDPWADDDTFEDVTFWTKKQP